METTSDLIKQVLTELRLTRQVMEIRFDQLRDDQDRRENAGFTFEREPEETRTGGSLDKQRAERVIAASDELYKSTTALNEQVMTMWKIVRRCQDMMRDLEKRVAKLETPP